MSKRDKLKAKLETHRRNSGKPSILPEKLERHRKAGENETRKEALEQIREAGTEALFDAKTRDPRRQKVAKMMHPREVAAAVATCTGIPSLDLALGGMASGVIEIYGEESTGKTTLLGATISRAQKVDMGVALLPTEFFDEPYFRAMGVDIDKLIMVRSSCWEDAYQPLYDFLNQGDRLLLAIDSATGLRPKKEGDDWAAKVLKFIHEAQQYMGPRSCVVMTNQVRARRSVDPNKFFAGGTDSTARRIAGCFSARMELSRENVKDSTFDMVVHIVSNILKRPMTYVTLPVRKGLGIWSELDVVDKGVEFGYIVKKGSWYKLKHEPEPAVHGKVNMAQLLSDKHSSWAETIRTAAIVQALR